MLFWYKAGASPKKLMTVYCYYERGREHLTEREQRGGPNHHFGGCSQTPDSVWNTRSSGKPMCLIYIYYIWN